MEDIRDGDVITTVVDSTNPNVKFYIFPSPLYNWLKIRNIDPRTRTKFSQSELDKITRIYRTIEDSSATRLMYDGGPYGP